jgi:hypothetical protein
LADQEILMTSMNLTPLDPALMRAVWGLDWTAARRELDREEPPAQPSLDAALVAAAQLGGDDALALCRLLLENGAKPDADNAKPLAWALARDDAELAAELGRRLFGPSADGRFDAARAWLGAVDWNPLAFAASRAASRSMAAWRENGLSPAFSRESCETVFVDVCANGSDEAAARELALLALATGYSPQLLSGSNAIKASTALGRNPWPGPTRAMCAEVFRPCWSGASVELALANALRTDALDAQPAGELRESTRERVALLAAIANWSNPASMLAGELTRHAGDDRLASRLLALLDAGAPVDGVRHAQALTPWEGTTNLLACAIDEGAPACAQLLLDRGALFGRDDDPKSPLGLAVRKLAEPNARPGQAQAAARVLAHAERLALAGVASAGVDRPAAPSRGPKAL